MIEEKPCITELKKGRYKVVSILGAGGFGITYLCRDVQNNRVCAIKEYLPEVIASRNEKTLEVLPQKDRVREYLHGKKRFFEEALILMKMKELPSMVNVWEAFEENNTAYYVMEYLNGRTLKQVMMDSGGKLPYPMALDVVVKVGGALDRMHRQAGIFHRDISPENIMLMPDGEIKIIDFGSAKAMAISENQQFSVVLKPGFAPPEQYSSKMSQGSFTDVYALAGTFYYAAAGRKLPAAPNRLMGENYVPLDQLVSQCSHKVSQAVDRALLMNPQYRTQTMSEFVSAMGKQRRKPARQKPVCTAKPSQAAKPVSRRLPKVWLLVSQGSCVGALFPILQDHWLQVGRSAVKSQIVLSGHAEISGLHFSLYYDSSNQCFYVIDKSVNGLYYQQTRLLKGKKYRVLPETELGVGSMKCRVILGVEKNG